MTALLTENLPLLAGAPNGIKKLRELILELAVRGKLVQQDPNDEPATDLLKRIAKKKALLAADGSAKKQKQLPGITQEEIPFDVPARWCWVRMGEIGETNIGLTYSPSDVSDTGIPVLRSSNVQKGQIDLSDLVRVDMLVKNSALVQEGDLLICARNGSKALVGKTAMLSNLTEPMAFGAFMAIFRSELNPYLLRFINSPLFRKVIDDVNTTTINQITQNNLRTTMVPLPPLGEQHRIVTKVDELMALCDRLEAQQADAESAHAQMVDALLGILIQDSDADEFAANWQCLAEHFHTLFTTEPSIDALKQILLQLAVMGKLVPQDPSDEPASELLKRIAEEKARLVADGRIKKQKSVTEIADEEKPFQLPAGWEWVRLDSLLKKLGAGSTPLGGKQGYISAGIKFLRSQNVWNEGLRLDDVALIPESTHQKMSGTHVEAGDLLFNITGASIGRCALVPDDFDTGNVSQHVTIIRPVAGELRHFLQVILTSQLVQQTVMDVQVGVSREGLSIGKLSMFVIPCPPEAEQHRIVAKIDQLMAICAELKSRLTQARQLNEQLASTLVEQAVA